MFWVIIALSSAVSLQAVNWEVGVVDYVTEIEGVCLLTPPCCV